MEGCKKAKFANEGAAQFMIDKLQRISKRENVPSRSYYCKECKAWHMTHRKPIKEVLEENTALKKENAELKKQLENIKRGTAT